MAPANPERATREAELFQKRTTWSLESEGILDRAGVPLREFIGNLERLIGEIKKQPPDRTELAASDLLRWHQFVFRRTKLPIVGRFRTEVDPKVGFAVPVVDSAADRLTELPVQIAAPVEIGPRLDVSFDRFESGARHEHDPHAKARLAAELWSEVLRVHPFNDGNTRTSMTLLQAALHRLGQPRFVTGPNDWELVVARSYALRPDSKQTTEPMTELIHQRTGGAP